MTYCSCIHLIGKFFVALEKNALCPIIPYFVGHLTRQNENMAGEAHLAPFFPNATGLQIVRVIELLSFFLVFLG